MNADLQAYLQGLSATHLWSFDNDGVDHGDSLTPSAFTIDNGSFETDPVCGGVDYCFTSITSTSRNDGGRVPSQNDINLEHDYGMSVRSIALWFRADAAIDAPTCIYEQGGGNNNFAITYGIARAITFQAADQNADFLIAQSLFQAELGRSYHVAGMWEHASQHAGSGNRALLIINGVLQDVVELGSAASFIINHSADVTFCNTAENLKSYNGSKMTFAAREKSINTTALINHVSLSEAQCRDWFERTVIPVHEITGTVAEQQSQLDALSGQTFAGVNCAIRIVQATDATDYRLFIDNITFIEDPNLRDIAIQFVGTGVLTLENVNGSNAVEISNPTEAYFDRSTTYTGGGSIVLVTSNTKRITTERALDNQTLDKLVITEAGDYTLTNCFIDEIENVSGGTINVTTDRGIAVVTDTGAGSVTNLLDSFLSFESVDSWILYPTANDRSSDNNSQASGSATDVHRFLFSGSTTYYLRVIKSGTVFFIDADVSGSGETEVNLAAEALLQGIASQVDSVQIDLEEVYDLVNSLETTWTDEEKDNAIEAINQARDCAADAANNTSDL